MAYESFDKDIMKIGSEQVAAGAKADPVSAVDILLKREKELAAVFVHPDNVKQLVDKTKGMFAEAFKPVKKVKTEKVTPKEAKPKTKPKGKKDPVSVKATPIAKQEAEVAASVETDIPDMS